MKNDPPVEFRVAGECLAGRVRVINRVVSGIYDDALRPFNVRISQMNILVAIAVMGPVRATDVGRRLRLEKSTLSRDLVRLLDRGWVKSVPAEGRNQQLELTAAGRAFIKKVARAWQSAQKRIIAMLGPDLTQGLFNAAEKLRAADSGN
jgi:DNA-binding MarR family transcriptional regulator